MASYASTRPKSRNSYHYHGVTVPQRTETDGGHALKIPPIQQLFGPKLASHPKPSARSLSPYQTVHFEPERQNCPSERMHAHYGPQRPHQAVQGEPEESKRQPSGQSQARYGPSSLMATPPFHLCQPIELQPERREHYPSGQSRARYTQPCHFCQEVKMQLEGSEFLPKQSRPLHSSSVSPTSSSQSYDDSIQSSSASLQWSQTSHCPLEPSRANLGSLPVRPVRLRSSPPNLDGELKQASSACEPTEQQLERHQKRKRASRVLQVQSVSLESSPTEHEGDSGQTSSASTQARMSSTKEARDWDHKINEKKRRDGEKVMFGVIQKIMEEGGVTLLPGPRGFVSKADKLVAAARHMQDLQKEVKKLRGLMRRLSISIPLCTEDWDDCEDSKAEPDTSSTR